MIPTPSLSTHVGRCGIAQRLINTMEGQSLATSQMSNPNPVAMVRGFIIDFE